MFHFTRPKMCNEITRFSFNHRAFYCYLGLSLWICILVTVMYKYMSVNYNNAKKEKYVMSDRPSRLDYKYNNIYLAHCNPPNVIKRGTEGAIDDDMWTLQGVLVVMRHGDRGPLNHLRDGDTLPCNKDQQSVLYKSYEQFVSNMTGAGGRSLLWGSAFRGFPPAPRGPPCALGQLTPTGLLQTIALGELLKNAYAMKLGLGSLESAMRNKETGEVLAYSTRYRRTYQSLLGVLWGFGGAAAGAGAPAALDSHSITYCFADCACPRAHDLTKKLNRESKTRLDAHANIKELVKRMSKIIFESYERIDAEILKDALLAYMCHGADLPCTNAAHKKNSKKKSLLRSDYTDKSGVRSLMNVDDDTLAVDLDYNLIDFNNDIAKQAKDVMRNDQKEPLDFDMLMEKEKLVYYQQKYMDSTYEDAFNGKKNLDYNFNDAGMEQVFDDHKVSDNFCIKKEHVATLFAYLEWSYRQEIKSDSNRKKSLLFAYGLIRNIVQNMIKMISEKKPKLVIYSGHDKTLHPLVAALGLDLSYHSINYATRIIFEVHRKKDLREAEFAKRAVAQDFYFRILHNGRDVTNDLAFCRRSRVEIVKFGNFDSDSAKVHLCPIESIVRFVHDEYFSAFNVSNFKDACADSDKHRG